MEIKKQTLPLESIELNGGQIDGLPANPRQWTLTDVEKLAASLKETPELLEMRCPIVVPHEGKYVTLGGNLRIAAARVNKEAQVPCFVLEDATTAKMKEIVIKDNGSFGKWDFDSLANEWTDEPLNDWGVEVWKPEEVDVDSLFEDKTDDNKIHEVKIEVFLPEEKFDLRGELCTKIEPIVKDYGGRVV